MLKRILVLVMIASLLAASVVSVAAADWGTSTMYVKTANGKSVTVRSGPSKSSEIVGYLKYGSRVTTDWSYAGNDGWTRVFFKKNGIEIKAYIMSHFLVDKYPGSAPKPKEKKEEKVDEAALLAQELQSEQIYDSPVYLAVHPARISGWVNFRTGPSTTTARISVFTEGKEVLATGETTNWYRVTDPDTKQGGYIMKTYATKIEKPFVVETQSAGGAQKLGSLSVNGEFDLTCVLPEGYNLNVVNMRGTSILATVLSEDMTKPQLYLSIAYDEAYSKAETMSDLTAEELAQLEASFTDMNEVDISYSQTGYGTKLLIARETGAETDFVDILAIYKGYFVEFNMTPNPKAASQTLTDDQIRMCIEFLTNIEFIPAEK